MADAEQIAREVPEALVQDVLHHLELRLRGIHREAMQGATVASPTASITAHELEELCDRVETRPGEALFAIEIARGVWAQHQRTGRVSQRQVDVLRKFLRHGPRV